MIKKTIVIIFLTLIILLGTVNAQEFEVQDTYLINDTYQLESKIPLPIEVEKYRINTYIDSRNIEKAESGGLCLDCDTNKYNYILPHDLGLGHHTLTFMLRDKQGNVVGEQEYHFNIVQGDEDTAIYDIVSPYHYTDLDSVEDYGAFINDDYNTILEQYNNGTDDYFVLVNLGEISLIPTHVRYVEA